MRNKQLLILSTFLTLMLTLPFLLNSCGGGGHGTVGQGTAAVLVKDAFQVTLPGGQVITEIRLTISQILMKKEMDPEDAWVEVPLNPSLIQPFNLLDLNNVAMLAAIGSVTAGEYEKVRLVLDQSFTPCIVLQGTTDCATLKVPSNKIDIILKPHVLVPEGGTTSIVLDFVPDKSIHVNDTGSSEKFILRPVIKALTTEDIPDGVRVHHEISGVVTACSENSIELSLQHDTAHVNIHYDSTTQFFSDDVEIASEQQVTLTNVTCADLSGKRVQVKVVALGDGTLHAVRIEIKTDLPEVEEFDVTGTLAANSSLTLHTTAADYTVIFPGGMVRVEGKLTDELTVLAREIETNEVAADEFDVIGQLQPQDSSLSLTNSAGTVYSITFPPQFIKVEGTLDSVTNTITARELEVLFSDDEDHHDL